jgi:hypothetical protein
MVVAALDHHKQVHGVGLPHGLGGQVFGRCGGLDARGAHVVIAPGGRGLTGLVDPLGQGLHFGGAQRAGKARAFAWRCGPGWITRSASAGRRRSRLSGSSAGPMPPVRWAPWQLAQCCWYSAAAEGTGGAAAGGGRAEVCASGLPWASGQQAGPHRARCARSKAAQGCMHGSFSG